MTQDEENLLARLEALNAREPDDATVADDASMDAIVDGATGVLERLAVARRPAPETDAARAGIAGFLDALDPRVDTILTLQRSDKPIPLKASHLRLVLAALDDEPPGQSAPPQAEELCLCYRDGCYVGLTGRCSCVERGVRNCPCLAKAGGNP